MLVRAEAGEDVPAIQDLNRQVFGGTYEAQLVDTLRLDGLVYSSLVAWAAGEIVGHILFSALPVWVDGREVRASALAPMAVAPGRQRQGIGSRLVVEGVSRQREQGIEAILVLGHRNYYPRFGFLPDLTRHLDSPFRGMPEFMGLELVVGALAGAGGRVSYPQAFKL